VAANAALCIIDFLNKARCIIKRTTRISAIAVVVLFVLTASLKAGPLDLRNVASDAQWVAHVDVDTMRTPPVFAKAFAAVSKHWEDVKPQLEELRDVFGLDLAKNLHSVTIYGNEFGQPTGVLIANVEVEQTTLEAKMQGAQGYQAIQHGSHTLHSWADHNGPLTGVFYTSTVLVFGRTASDVAAAIDVMDGKSPSLAGKDSPLAAKVPAGVMFVGRAIRLANADLPWKSPLLQQSESVVTSLAVSNDAVDCEVQLVAKSMESVSLIKDVIRGIIAMGELQFGPDPNLTALFSAIKIQDAGKTVTVTWHASVADVWTQAEKAFDRWEKASQ